MDNNSLVIARVLELAKTIEQGLEWAGSPTNDDMSPDTWYRMRQAIHSSVTFAANLSSLGLSGDAEAIEATAKQLEMRLNERFFTLASREATDEQVAQWQHLYGDFAELPLTDEDREIDSDAVMAMRGKAIQLRDKVRSVVPTLRSELAAAPPRGDDVDETYPFCHSDDYRSVKWGERTYSFTPGQAQVIRVLWANWLRGTFDVGSETLLDAVDSEAPPARLDTLFRNHDAWKTMIVQGQTRGSYRLSGEPPRNS